MGTMMNAEMFQTILKTEFEYHSRKPGRLSARKLPVWAATGVYYFRLLSIIYSSSKVAKRGKYTLKKWISDSHQIFGFVEEVGGEVHVSGIRDAARHHGPMVFIANHMSMLDTFLLPGLIAPFRKATFVIKQSLLDYPFFGWIMRAVNPISLERKNPRTDLKIVLETGQRLLKEGCSIVIFPQSTRSARFDESNFNSLGVKLAKQAGAFVVPVALKTDFQANGRYIKEMGQVDPRKTVHIKFGSPMPVIGNGQATHYKIIEFIKKNLSHWGAGIGESDPFIRIT